MPTDTIITTLLSAAAFLKEPIRAIASQSFRDVYEATRYYLRKKFGAASRAATALELATEKPDSPARRTMLIEEAEPVRLERDPELVRLVQTLAALLGGLGAVLPASVADQCFAQSRAGRRPRCGEHGAARGAKRNHAMAPAAQKRGFPNPVARRRRSFPTPRADAPSLATRTEAECASLHSTASAPQPIPPENCKRTSPA